MSWSGNGGSVGATCRDTAISLGYATPKDGWSVQPPTQAGGQLSVAFTRSGRRSVLTATCRAGVPEGSFAETATSGGGHDGGDDGGGSGSGGGHDD